MIAQQSVELTFDDDFIIRLEKRHGQPMPTILTNVCNESGYVEIGIIDQENGDLLITENGVITFRAYHRDNRLAVVPTGTNGEPVVDHEEKLKTLAETLEDGARDEIWYTEWDDPDDPENDSMLYIKNLRTAMTEAAETLRYFGKYGL